ncbi:MAG: DNA primase [SAR324 cluster bacterium]|nr:DNA primase [SAR324 cluster bacterium]
MDNKESAKIIKDRTDIIALIGGYTNLKQAGRNYIGLCPFHKEKTPSFVVSVDYQNYHCYGCEAHGDVFSFLQRVENLNFFTALSQLAERAGITINRYKSADDKLVDKEIEQMFACLKLASKFYLNQLDELSAGSPVRKFIEKRKFDMKILNEFMTGFASNQKDALGNFLLNKKIPIKVIEDCGLARNNPEWGKYDFFKNRIMFPIKDELGRTIAFAGRSMESSSSFKYINSPDSKVYHKNAVFYGIDKAKDYWRKKRRAIIVEGYLDVIRMHEHGFEETVATCGTALSEKHINILKNQRINGTYLLFDNDSAGHAAAIKSSILFIKKELAAKVVLLKGGNDPDEFLQDHLASDLEKFFDAAISAEDFYIAHHHQEFQKSDVNQKAKIIDSLVGLYPHAGSPLKYDLWISKIADNFKIDKQNITNKNFAKSAPTPLSVGSLNSSLHEIKNMERSFSQEFRILRWLIKFPKSLVICKKFLTGKDFPAELSQFYEDISALNEASLTKIISDNESIVWGGNIHLFSYILQTAWAVKYDEFMQKEFESLIHHLLSDKFRQRLDNKLKMTIDIGEKSKIFEEYQACTQKIESINHRKNYQLKKQFYRHKI